MSYVPGFSPCTYRARRPERWRSTTLDSTRFIKNYIILFKESLQFPFTYIIKFNLPGETEMKINVIELTQEKEVENC